MNQSKVGAKAIKLYGLILLGIGIYFMFFRPPMLTEDFRYIGANLSQISIVAPGILAWLDKVFLVLGGFIVATAVLTIQVATAFAANHSKGHLISLAVAGFFSIGVMVVVNFLIGSDFKLPLLLLGCLWLFGVALMTLSPVPKGDSK